MIRSMFRSSANLILIIIVFADLFTILINKIEI